MRTIIALLTFLFNYKRYINQPSFYPEKPHKSRIEIFRDFITRILRYGEIEKSYFAYGLDVQGSDSEDFLPYSIYVKSRDNFNGLNKKGSQGASYACTVKDKHLFEIICKGYSLPTVCTLGVYSNSRVTNCGQSINLEQFLNNHPSLFMKPNDSYKGHHAFAVESKDGHYLLNGEIIGLDTMVEKLNVPGIELMVQEKLVQHAELSRIYPNSINTVRIITAIKNDEVMIVGQFLRLGGHGSVVDNMSAGGLRVGVNDDGTLQEYGFLHKKYGTKTTCHPDTGVVFSTYKIPYFQEAISLVKDAQRKFHYIPTIGWDVCITETGPILLEANAKYGCVGLQTICGGKAKIFRNLFMK